MTHRSLTSERTQYQTPDNKSYQNTMLYLVIAITKLIWPFL